MDLKTSFGNECSFMGIGTGVYTDNNGSGSKVEKTISKCQTIPAP